MEENIISIEEMIDYIYEKSKLMSLSISIDKIKTILDLQEEFLDSKGLISIEEDKY
ncbi:hypothetical protein [[Clostridium] dakarense]|uniref:hypothetical protein n=1 Tax=Faecalimicrobium dakarense TaxID=1301100 RepID=UPI0004BBBA9C|nr:hypothetical protein [[Clostridium] dakarense]